MKSTKFSTGKKKKKKKKTSVCSENIVRERRAERGGQRVDEDFCGALGSRRSRLDKNDPLQESERLFHHRKINISTVPRTRTATAVVGIGHVKVPHDVYTKRDEGSLVQPRASLHKDFRVKTDFSITKRNHS